MPHIQCQQGYYAHLSLVLNVKKEQICLCLQIDTRRMEFACTIFQKVLLASYRVHMQFK